MNTPNDSNELKAVTNIPSTEFIKLAQVGDTIFQHGETKTVTAKRWELKQDGTYSVGVFFG